jgi:diaminopimelate decarboxylase
VTSHDSNRVLRPPSLKYRSSGGSLELHSEDVSLTQLAKRYGTPLYVYSAQTFRQRLQQFDAAFSAIPHTICYSVKASSTVGLLRLVARAGHGFDVVSIGELERVRKASPLAVRKAVFSGVGKTVEEMANAIKAGILLFNVESESELRALAATAKRLRKVAHVALRVNPDVPAETHPYISTGLTEHKFGVPIDDARRLYKEASRLSHLRVSGVSVHIGSQITEVSSFAIAMTRIASLVSELRADGHEIRYVDAGGGYGIPYDSAQPDDFSHDVKEYAKAVSAPLSELNIHLLLEPGRSIVGPAGVLLSKVLYRKTNGNKRFLVVDAAMNDLLRPSLYKAFHEIVAVKKQASESMEETDIVGPICETGDFFARDRSLPIVPEGGLIAILDTGAYGMSLSSNYNTRPRAAEVLVEDRTVRLIRKRETIRDLLRTER